VLVRGYRLQSPGLHPHTYGHLTSQELTVGQWRRDTVLLNVVSMKKEKKEK
jgi:hypothetical protein